MEGASAAAHALSLPAEAYGNDVSTEGQELQCFNAEVGSVAESINVTTNGNNIL